MATNESLSRVSPILIQSRPMQSEPIQAIVFDLGGVLLDWDPRYLYQSYFEKPQEMEEFLSEIDFASWNSQQDQGRRFAEGVADLSARFPHRAALIRAYHRNWERSISGPIIGTVNLLRALKAAGYPLYALSNWSAETFPLAYQKYQFLHLFNDVLISGAVRLVKPDPRIFRLILSKVGLPAKNCLLIDDSPENIAVASKLGFRVAQFSTAEALEKLLRELELLDSSWRLNLIE
jgi:2-haloacid dehalogenase